MAEEVDILFGFWIWVGSRQGGLMSNESGATRGHMSPIAISPCASYCYCDVILIV